MTDSCCPVPHREPGECLHCTGGVIALPAGLYDPAELACPWCQPDAYPDGFPGLKVAGADRWLIPPSQSGAINEMSSGSDPISSPSR